jgi:hypothetical protein
VGGILSLLVAKNVPSYQVILNFFTEELEAQRKHKDSDETLRRQQLAEEDKQRRLNQFQKIACDPNSVRRDDPRLNVDVVKDMAQLNEATKQKTLENVKELVSREDRGLNENNSKKWHTDKKSSYF